MLNEKSVQGTNLTSFYAGPKEGWTEFRLESPDVPVPARGKLFLRSLLASAGLELSLNVVPPGTGRTTRFTSSSVAGASSSWTARASTWRKDRSCASPRRRHGPGATTRMRRCTSSASSFGPTA